ncbi:MAG TPA: hypothetical protein VLZ06_07245 [Solirubrobacteraceae bacterium]|nr:hypothetical protein [Solirubrobacteraceae bacterium]
MAERHGSHPAPAPRALAELAAEDSLARREAIARRWIVALISSRPLEDLGSLPLERLAREAPGLCGQLIDAVRSDRALERLRERGGTDRPGADRDAGVGGAVPEGTDVGELTGAHTAADLVDALELLRGVLSGALLEDVPEPSPRQAADLCERIAHVCAAMLAGALPGAPAAGRPGFPEERAEGDPPAPPPSAVQPTAQQPTAPAPGARPLIVDELEGAGGAGGEPFVSRAGGERGGAIAARDRRGEHQPAEWLEAIARELDRDEPGQQPFAILLVELRDLERLRLQSTPARLAEDLASLERGLADNGSVIRERTGRYWLLAPGVERRGARALAERVAASVSAAGTDQPLGTLIGIAVYPADGRHAAALAAHADVDLLAARAARR